MHEGFLRLEPRSLRTSIRRPLPVPAEAVTRGSVELDLHTTTALIGRTDLDVTLDFLRLDEEATNGYIDIYAVPRVSDAVDNPYEVGKETMYRLSNCWVCSQPYSNHRNIMIRHSQTPITVASSRL